MSKPNIPNQRKANIEHKKRIEAFIMRINLVYEALNKEAARIASTTGHSGDTPFSFKDYPLTKDAVQQLITSYLSQIGGIIMAGTSQEWNESNLLQDLLAEKVFKAYKRTNRKGEELGEYFRDNSEALKAFQQRKDNGMQLSDRVWNLSKQYKQELEESISVAIEPGISAVELAAKIKPYLNEPNKRFRRIRDKFGVLQLSNNALAYHPGRGVYRSSARNAQRLARTEINMAYRHAEQLRWSQMDFVVGYEVKLTQNGKHVPDICDELVGKYPKEFKFSGWHPHCLCYTIPILKTEEEFLSLDEAKPSVNAITDTPANFKQWVWDNKERIEAAYERGKLPYFLRDNMDAWERVVYPESKSNYKYGYGAAMKLGRAATKEAMKVIEDIGAPVLSKEQKQNIYELADALGIPRKDVKPMSFVDADHGISNPEKDKDNCQSVVVSFVARRRGLDCVALPFSEQNLSQIELMKHFQNAFLIKDKKGNYRPITPTIVKGKTDEEVIAKTRKLLSADGEYVLGINYVKESWEKEAQGHVVNLVKKGKQIFINDEQISDILKLDSYSKIESFEIIKIDNSIFDIEKVKFILNLR